MRVSGSNALAVSDAPDATQIVRTDLRSILARIIADKGLSQTRTAKLCSTDQPTLSKCLSGRSDSISTDQLLRWLVQLGCNVEIKISSRRDLIPGTVKAVIDE